jgi:hypothetical protein
LSRDSQGVNLFLYAGNFLFFDSKHVHWIFHCDFLL